MCVIRGNSNHDMAFYPNMRKKFFNVRVAEDWNRLHGEAIESPSLEVFKSHPDTILSNRIKGTLPELGDWMSSPPVVSSNINHAMI